MFQQYKSYYRQLAAIGIPIVIGQIGVIVLGLADTLMIGHHSTQELAAASFVNNVFNLVIIFSTGFSYGLTPVIGALYGQNNLRATGQVLKNSLLANALVALGLMSAMGVLYAFVDRLGQPEELLPLIRPYYLILLASLLFVLLFNGFKQFADGLTDTKISMWILLGGNVLNIIGNYILINGKLGFPELGLAGAGLSTLFSRILMVAVFAFIFFCTRRYAPSLQGYRKGRINKKDFFRLNQLGFPVALQMGMETASFSLSAIMIGWLGTIALAAHQIMLAISQICFMMYYGMGAAVAVLASNHYGRGEVAAIRRSANAGFHLILLMAVATSVPIFLLRDYWGGLFTDNETVGATVATLVIPLLIYQFGDGLQINFANALRGISDVRPMMFIAFIAYFVISLPVGYICGFVLDWGITGIWMAFPFGLTTAGILYYLRFRHKTQHLSF